jgi:cytochrome c553
MRRGIGCVLVLLTLTLVGAAQEEEVAGVDSIKVIMSKAHKEPLLLKVYSGKADQADKLQLVALYTALAKNRPPRGEIKDWKDRTEAMLKAAKDVAAGVKDAEKRLRQVTNCRSCHEAFK